MSKSGPSTLEVIATICFSLAVLHTFFANKFVSLAHRFREGSVRENLFHLIGEIEIVFGVWAGIFLAVSTLMTSKSEVLEYMQSRNFTEPAFVFVIMACCATRPILSGAEKLISWVSTLLPFGSLMNFYLTALVVGPLLGSFITEPAAMTITALLLFKRFYSLEISDKFKYATLGLLFVNVSIGGTLTPYAAPPVLMVASVWQWNIGFMLQHFGWKAASAVLISAACMAWFFRQEIDALEKTRSFRQEKQEVPIWVIISHLIVLALVVLASHYMVIFIGLFMLFLGLVTVTKEFHDELKLREALLVAFFLGGLVILGGPQKWWLEPIISGLTTLSLYFGTMALTAITDNAALTFLGSQVDGLTEAAKYSLVAGSVVGGGLTVIANAPNPAGFGILNSSFGEDGIHPAKLFLGALFPTLVAAALLFPW